jgi:hypothetical protein
VLFEKGVCVVLAGLNFGIVTVGFVCGADSTERYYCDSCVCGADWTVNSYCDSGVCVWC